MEQLLIPLVTVLIAAVTFGGIVYANTKVLKNSMFNLSEGFKIMRDEMRSDVNKITDLMLLQNTQSGRIDRVEDRVAAQGKRLDENSSRVNSFLDSELLKRLSPNHAKS